MASKASPVNFCQNFQANFQTHALRNTALTLLALTLITVGALAFAHVLRFQTMSAVTSGVLFTSLGGASLILLGFILACNPKLKADGKSREYVERTVAVKEFTKNKDPSDSTKATFHDVKPLMLPGDVAFCKEDGMRQLWVCTGFDTNNNGLNEPHVILFKSEKEWSESYSGDGFKARIDALKLQKIEFMKTGQTFSAWRMPLVISDVKNAFKQS